jgi:hypothetical protein
MSDKSKKRKTPSRAARIRIAILGFVQLVLLATALWDLRQRPVEQINGSKWLWTPIVFINFFGPIAYFTLGRKKLA